MKGGVKAMIVRLHNLLARAPRMEDVIDIADLRAVSDHGSSRSVSDEEVIRASWSKSGFRLALDAWVITTKQGQIVSYADVQCQAEEPALELVLALYVLPDYRNRGIERLLIWLVEERARQIMHATTRAVRTTLSSCILNDDSWAAETLSHEGYIRTRHFWRVGIEFKQVFAQQLATSSHTEPFLLDLVLDTGKAKDEIMSVQSCSDMNLQTCMMSTMRQYDVYEKVLRMGACGELEQDLVMQYATV